MNNNEFFEAISLMEKEKGIPANYLAEKIASAIVVSVKKDYNGKDCVFCNIETNTAVEIFLYGHVSCCMVEIVAHYAVTV